MRSTSLAAVLLLLAAHPAWAESFTYKGRNVTMPDGGRNAMFEDYIRKAIDMAETLPPKYKSLAAQVTDLRYEPIPSDATDTTAHQNVTGTYVIESKDSLKGHISFYRNPAFISPSNYVMSLVGNGIYRQRHAKYVEAQKKGDKAQIDYYEAIMMGKKKDLKLALKAECEIMDTEIGVMKALALDPKRIDAMTKERNNRGC